MGTYRYTGKTTRQFENDEVYELSDHQVEYIGDQFDAVDADTVPSADEDSGAADAADADADDTADTADTDGSGEDDLTELEGVGSGVEDRLIDEGIDSFRALRDASIESVEHALDGVPSTEARDIKDRAEYKE